jgi:hypothetical protein
MHLQSVYLLYSDTLEVCYFCTTFRCMVAHLRIGYVLSTNGLYKDDHRIANDSHSHNSHQSSIHVKTDGIVQANEYTLLCV